MMQNTQGLEVYCGRVPPEWIDYNGHMNIAFYVVAFSKAVDALLDLIGMDTQYRHENNSSVFTTEAHISYLREMHEGEAFSVTLKFLGYDEKRLHVFSSMLRGDESTLVATSEQMFLHVDTSTRKVVPFDPKTRDEILKLWMDNPITDIPPQVGRSIMTLANSRVGHSCA